MNGGVRTVISADGTTIGYEQSGSGPAIILVGGAFCDRNFAGELPSLLGDEYTVITYDRRGRGDSTDTPPYEVAREVEDLQALADGAGGCSHVFGVSSGAILALEAAASGMPVGKLVLVEPPYSVDDSREPVPNLAANYTELCNSGRPGDAVALFMTKAVGQPPEAVEQVRNSPMWDGLVAMAPTLAYDAMITGDGSLPKERLATIDAPTLMIESTMSPTWLCSATRAVADAMPSGEHRRLEGEFHRPNNALMATEMKRFLRD